MQGLLFGVEAYVVDPGGTLADYLTFSILAARPPSYRLRS